MDAKTKLKNKLPSRDVTEGPERASNRAYAALHLPAIANECGVKFDLFDVAEVFKRTPYIADLKPGGRYVAKDLFEAGGVPLLMKTLLDHGFLHGACMTVTGRTVAENLESVRWNDAQDVVRSAGKPLLTTGGVVGLVGNLAADGAIVKVAGMSNLTFSGAARCFDGEEACFEAVKNRAYKEGDVFVIRYEGPQGGPGMREMLATTAALYGQGTGDIWKYAEQVGSARHGAVTRPGAAAETSCHADI